MANEMQIFKNDEFGRVRIVEINNEPYFVGKDVAEALGYQNGSRDINAHVDEEDKTTTLIQGTGSNYHVDNEDKLDNESLLSLGQRGGWVINESVLYRSVKPLPLGMGI